MDAEKSENLVQPDGARENNRDGHGDLNLQIKGTGDCRVHQRRVALLGNLIDGHANKADDVLGKEETRDTGNDYRNSRDEEALTQFPKVITERHSHVALSAPPA